MRILFIFCRPQPYNSQSVREKPSGGTEKSIIFLGEALRDRGHMVEFATTPAALNSVLTGNAWFQKEGLEIDVVVTQVAEILEHFPNAKKIWWTHHFADQPVIQQNAAFARCFADRIVTLSQCHHDDFKANLRMESVICGHGLHFNELATPTQKDPYRLIYASTPFRGLEKIPALFAQIKAAEPRATIAICSSMGTYGEVEADAQYQPLFDELSGIEGVELLGALNQSDLYAQYARASIFFYPCTWPETYCLALDEAIAHGCYPVTTNLGALEERNRQIQLGLDEPNTLNALTAFTKELMKRPQEFYDTRPRDWSAVAEQWEREILC